VQKITTQNCLINLYTGNKHRRKKGRNPSPNRLQQAWVKGKKFKTFFCAAVINMGIADEL